MNVTAKWRWNSVERAAWAESLQSRPCPECGWGELRYFQYREPMFFANGVSFGHWSCTAYGQCELAPG